MNPLFPPSPAAEARAALLSAPHTLHPGLWRAQGRAAIARTEVLPSGFAPLDAELPGGGWPLRVLTELLLARAGLGEVRLLAPALAAVASQGRCLMFFDPPAGLCAEGLSQLGLPVGQCLLVRGRDGVRHSVLRQRLGSADLAWALEQALRSGQVGAVLAWPGAHWQPEVLRRLQVAAQAHPGPVFMLRGLAARGRPSPAPLRLALHTAGPDALSLHILKRRGPLLERPVQLVLPSVLTVRGLARAHSPLGRPAVVEVEAVVGSADWLRQLGPAVRSA